MGIFWVGVILRGNFLWWELSGWELSSGNHLGGSFSGGSFYVTIYSFSKCLLFYRDQNKNMKQATLKKFGFTRRVKHRGEKVNIDITAYVEFVEDTDIPCPNCNLKFKNKRALGSHIAFKRGKYAEVSSSLQILGSKA